MATGKASDFKVYQEYMQTRIAEVLTQNGNAFNSASRGAIRLTTASKRGDYEYNAFFKSTANLITRRDTTSVADVTDTPLTQDEKISVKINRKIGPLAQTRDAFRKTFGRYNQTEFSGIIGEQSAVAMQLEMLNTALRATRAALTNQAAVVYSLGAGTMTTQGLVNALAKRGDRAGDIVCWVMHSKPFYDLVLNQIAANIDGISNFNVANAQPVTLNRPVIVTDSDALIASLGSPTTDYTYYTLGLTADSVIVENSESEEVVFEDVTGKENLIIRMQGEFAYNLGVKGFKWDVGNGGANPNDTAIGTGSNWDSCVTSYKDFAGVVLTSR